MRSTSRTNGSFQSTPLREGRLIPYLQAWLKTKVSIHAPARGATAARMEYNVA